MNSMINNFKLNIFSAVFKLVGTTYSGHPTATTLCGTLRNIIYNWFSINLVQNGFTFGG